MKRIRKLTTAFLVIALLVTSLVSAPAFAADEPEVVRIAGDSRYLTAIEVSKKAYPTATNINVVIASGENFPDALAGSVLAHNLGVPILLAKKDSIDDKTLAEIKRLGATKVTILGGEKAIGAPVVNALTKKGLTVTTIEGVNRYETAAKIAKEVGASDDNTVFLATGENYADALAIGPYAAAKGIPILLTTSNALHKDTAKALKDLKVKEVVILGGEKAVSKAVERSVEELGISEIKRIAGASRELTALAIAKAYSDGLSKDTLIAVTGDNFADAVVGAYFGALPAANEESPTPILLVRDTLSDEVDGFIRGFKIDKEGEFVLGVDGDPVAEDGFDAFTKLYIIGGPKAVSERNEVKLAEALQMFDIKLTDDVYSVFYKGAATADAVFTVGGNYDTTASVAVVKVGTETLTANYNFNFTSKVLTIKKEYLNKLAVGEYEVALTLDGFLVEDLEIVVLDPALATLEVATTLPYPAKIVLKKETPFKITLAGYDPAIAGEDKTVISFARAQVFVDGDLLAANKYTAAGKDVTLLGAYVKTLPAGKHTVKIVLYDGREAETTFDIVDGSKQFASFNEIAAAKVEPVEKTVDDIADLDVYVHILGPDGVNSAFVATKPLDVSFKGVKLVNEIGYEVAENKITIKEAVLQGLEPGEYPIVVTYDGKALAPLTVEILAGAPVKANSEVKIAMPVKVKKAAAITIELKDADYNPAMADEVIIVKAELPGGLDSLDEDVVEVYFSLKSDMSNPEEVGDTGGSIPVRLDKNGKATVYFWSNSITVGTGPFKVTVTDIKGTDIGFDDVIEFAVTK